VWLLSGEDICWCIDAIANQGLEGMRENMCAVNAGNRETTDWDKEPRVTARGYTSIAEIQLDSQ
jgi:hypothetical protein